MKKHRNYNDLHCWRAIATAGVAAIAIGNPLGNQFAQAQLTDFHLGQRPVNCSNPMTQAQMNACAAQRWEATDRELNRVYQTLTPNLSNARRQQLVDAQLAWIEFRDAECEFESSIAEGGSMQPMLRSGCMATLTEQRTTELYEYRRGTIPGAIGSNYQSADNRLNSVYQRLMRELGESRQDQLKDAELAWIGYRDALCKFERSGGGNSGYNTCMIRLTEERTNQLEIHLENSLYGERIPYSDQYLADLTLPPSRKPEKS